MGPAALYLGVWFLWALAARALLDNPRGDVPSGLVYTFARLYARWFHRLSIQGLDHLPASRHPGPLIVACNHTAGVDPILVGSAAPFHIRWMMGRDMMAPAFQKLWDWIDIIGVNRQGRDLAGTREALRHLQSGGVLGVFPEGGLERPPRTLRRFHQGAGFLIARTHAPVLPVWIDGTPQVDPAWASLWRPSHATIRFGPLMHFPPGATPDQITASLLAWFRDVSGWPGPDRSR